MELLTTRFGPISIGDEHIITFNQGIPGFEGERSFAIVPHTEDSPFLFLQSVADPDLAFVITDPFIFFKDYEFKLDEQTISDLGLSETVLPAVYCIVTIPQEAKDMSVNLLAPVIINPETREGMQVVLDKKEYTTRHRLFPAEVTAAAAGEGK